MKKLLLSLFLAVSAGLLLPAAEQKSIMYPACFQKNVFHICENLTGSLGFYPLNEPQTTKATLHLEIPAFLKYDSSGFSMGKVADKAVQRNIKRNGQPYTRIDITLSQPFISYWNQFKKTSSVPFYLKEIILLSAVKGSAGKSAPLYWSMTTERGKSKEQFLTVRVLKAPLMPSKGTKYFTTGVAGIESITGKYDPYVKEVCAFLKGLTSAEIYANLRYDDPVPDPGFSSAKSSGSVCFFPNFRPDPLEREIRLGKWDHKYPTVKNHYNYRGLALSYMVKDPEGFFAKYLKDGLLRFKKSAPHARYLRWDYEPLASQYTPYDLEIFCKEYMKLKQVLTYAQIRKSYPRQWSDFMHEMSAKLVRKYREAQQKYWPEVSLVMVSGFMDKKYPENKYRSIYTPLDVRETEKYFDVHSPMIYWQGTEFYDDVELNMRYLKKPFIPWIDPSEHSQVFYERYTPRGVRQNILACAILGAKGIVFYPVASLDGAYFPQIADAFSQIAGAEEILHGGVNITAKCKVTAVNAVKIDLIDSAGKSVQVVMPRYDEKIRYCIRKKGSKYAAGLFNYNNDTVYLRLDIPGFAKGALVKLAPHDAVILTELPKNQAALEKELASEISKAKRSRNFDRVKFGGSMVAWRALEGKALPALMTGGCTFTVDTAMAAPRAWTCPFPTWDPMFNPRRERGYLGRIFLMDNTVPLPLEFTLKKFLIDRKRPSMILEHIQKPFGGFQEMKNKFEGLHITSQWTLDFNGKKAFLKITAKNLNPRKETIPLRLKIHSFPRIGVKFGPKFAPGVLSVDGRTVTSELESNFILTRKGKKSGMTNARIPEHEWKNPGLVAIFCTPPGRLERLTITPDSKSAAFYTWYRGKEMTAEFLTEETALSYGQSISYTYIFEYALTRRKGK